MSAIAIIDYEMGNLHSIAKAVEHVAGGARVVVSSEAQDILAAERVIFPGVGGIGHCMDALRRRGLDNVIREAVATRPVLGICLGMQALLDRSEENGGTACLGLIPGEVRRFAENPVDTRSGARLKVPHMGWNQVHRNRDHPMWDGVDQDSRFYFVHSYYAAPAESGDAAATAEYGGEFCCALARGSLFAVQFHPEKSQRAGLTLLRNFSHWDGRS